MIKRHKILTAMMLACMGMSVAGCLAPNKPATEASRPSARQSPASQATTKPDDKLPPALRNGEQSLKDFEYKAGPNMLWQILASVLVILVLGPVALFFAKRILPRMRISPGKKVSVLETTHIGPRKTLHILQVGSRKLLVTNTREGISLLADVTDALDKPAQDENVDAETDE